MNMKLFYYTRQIRLMTAAAGSRFASKSFQTMPLVSSIGGRREQLAPMQKMRSGIGHGWYLFEMRNTQDILMYTSKYPL